MLKILKANIRQISDSVIIVSLNILAWHKTLFQVPMGEGYYYFNEMQRFFTKDCIKSLDCFDNFARMITDLMIPMFKDNLFLYMLFQLIVFILFYLSIYWVLWKITGRRTFATVATLWFSLSYVGSFTMVATGNYQRFLQRVPNLIPLVWSLYYLNKGIIKHKKYILVSYLLYVLAFLMSHHSTFLAPLLILYPLTFVLESKQKIGSLLIGFIVSLVFSIATINMTSTDNFVPKQGIVDFLLTTSQVIEKTLLQIPTLFIPPNFLKFLATQIINPPIFYPYVTVVKYALLALLILMIPISIKVWKHHQNIRKLYFLCLLLIPISSFITLYAYGGTPHPLNSFGEDRIYFITSLFAAIISGGIVEVLSGKQLIKKLIYIFIIFILLNNIYLIWKNTDRTMYVSQEMKYFIAYTKNLGEKIDRKTVIVAPSHLMWPAEFTGRFYGNGKLQYTLAGENWEKEVEEYGKDSVYILDYDFQLDPTKEPDPSKGVLLDLTQKYRDGEKIIFK